MAKRELEKAMEHSHQQVTVTVSSFSSGVRVSRATDCFLSHFLSMSSFSRNKSSWSACPTCSRRCVPVATACTDLDHEIHSLNETIDTLTRELELKGKEVLRVRSEANHQIRYVTFKTSYSSYGKHSHSLLLLSMVQN